MICLRHVGLAALLASAPLPALAASASDISWLQIDCKRSQLELFSWMQCRVSADDTVEKNLKGTARHYATLGGGNDATAGMVLSVPQDDGYFQAYAAPESEQAIRTTVGGAGRKVDQWGPFKGFDSTSYMTFVSDGMNCVGFDHGGKFTGQKSAEEGYSFLLKGYFCERGPIGDPQARLVNYLEATRVGPEFLHRNALGDRVKPLNVPYWQGAGAPMAPFAIGPQPTIGSTALAPMPMGVVFPTAQSMPARLTWAGTASQGTAQIAPQSGGRSANWAYGAMTPGLSCNGSLIATAGAIGVGVPNEGTWSAACSNGQTASGTYRSDSSGRAIGSGTDAFGRSVEISFGG